MFVWLSLHFFWLHSPSHHLDNASDRPLWEDGIGSLCTFSGYSPSRRSASLKPTHTQPTNKQPKTNRGTNDASGRMGLDFLVVCHN